MQHPEVHAKVEQLESRLLWRIKRGQVTYELARAAPDIVDAESPDARCEIGARVEGVQEQARLRDGREVDVRIQEGGANTQEAAAGEEEGVGGHWWAKGELASRKVGQTRIGGGEGRARHRHRSRAGQA